MKSKHLLIAVCLLIALPAHAVQLKGGVQDGDEPNPFQIRIEGLCYPMTDGMPILRELPGSAIERPPFVCATAYTAPDMIKNWHKYLGPIPLYPIKIPKRGGKHHWVITPESVMARHWTGGVIITDTPCIISPVEGHPGNFYFQPKDGLSGPKGWMEDMHQRNKDGPMYRVWLDQ